MNSRWVFFRGVLVLGLLAGCNRDVTVTSRPTTARTPPATAASMPELRWIESSRLRATLLGLEPAGHYTYLQVQSANGERWAVVLGTPKVAVGQRLELAIYGSKEHFTSRRLKRQFDELLFARLISTSAAIAAFNQETKP